MNKIKLFFEMKNYFKNGYGITNQKISASMMRKMFDNKICTPGYRFYLKNFGYKEYNVNWFIIRFVFIKDIDKQLDKILFT